MSLAKRITVGALLCALALCLSYIERFLPLPLPVPGVKLGLANLVVLCALVLLGFRAAFAVSMLRVLLAGFAFAGFSSLLFSLSGALLSLCVMGLATKAACFPCPLQAPLAAWCTTRHSCLSHL